VTNIVVYLLACLTVTCVIAGIQVKINLIIALLTIIGDIGIILDDLETSYSCGASHADSPACHAIKTIFIITFFTLLLTFYAF